jgi:hypothetical protein
MPFGNVEVMTLSSSSLKCIGRKSFAIRLAFFQEVDVEVSIL